MIGLLCDNCESELRKNWKFCPVCGSEVIRGDIFISLGNILKSITREMEPFQETEELSGYSAEQPREKEEREKPPRARYRISADVKDPKMTVRNLGNRMIFRIKMPGVEPAQVSLTELDESLEVKAGSKHVSYFKIIAAPRGFTLSEQYFENGTLVLEFAA
ncbi:MAG: hypothetical protein HY516_04675 [Candidatus Aenigmarchaeota archaeon]|nr:hypothetical protein [Candidatus Aenigmarchaeota archaeon]